MPTDRRQPQPHLRRVRALGLASGFALALAACQHAPPPPSNATPEKAVATNLRLTSMGDFDGLMKNRLPAADYAAWRRDWDQQHAHPVPATVDQQRQFAQIMQMLTEPGAEAKLAKRLQPELARMRGGRNEPVPIMGGILAAALKQMVATSPQLGTAQRALATQALDALIAWAKTVDFGDAKKAKKAIALVCATARELRVQTLDQWRALDYATTMRDYGILWNGLESLFDIYGLDLAGSLDNARISATATDATHATVHLELTLAHRQLSGAWPMLKQDEHWYDAALLEAWRHAHPVAAATTAASPASGTSSGAGTSIPSRVAPPVSSGAATLPAASSGPAASDS